MPIFNCVDYTSYFYQLQLLGDITHFSWFRTLKLGDPIVQETLSEYIATLDTLMEKVERMDKRIEELAQKKAYARQVKQLGCLKGISTHTALSLVVEAGDFYRFPTAERFASFLGLVPGEHSSGDSRNRFGITKAGNSHLRRLLTEAANTFNRGYPGKKSATLDSAPKNAFDVLPATNSKANRIFLRRRKSIIAFFSDWLSRASRLRRWLQFPARNLKAN